METDRSKQLLERVRATICQETGVPVSRIEPNSTLVSLVEDSLEMASLAIALDEDFGVDVNRRDLNNLSTVADVVKFIEARE